MIRCINELCKSTSWIINTDYTNYNIIFTECTLTHYANKFQIDISCPCMECIVKPICTKACTEKYKIIDYLHDVLLEKHNLNIFEY